jgi:Fe-S-cluster containining protein
MLEWKGFTIKDNMIVLDAPCKYLTSDNLCSIYETKPTYCTKFPVEGMVGAPEGCGYENT